MILVIDTSSSTAAVAIIDEQTGAIAEHSVPSRSPELVPLLRRLAKENAITRVAVVTGPGSFTGLRVGVSFGLGLAMGLEVPIVPLHTLDLQAARSGTPVTAVVEAGRGRFYFKVPGAEAALGDPGDIPASYPLAGRLSPSAEAALTAAGHAFEAESGLRTFGQAAKFLLESAREVAYGSLKLDYMQSFSARLVK